MYFKFKKKHNATNVLKTTNFEVPIFIFIFLKNSTIFHKLIQICLYIYLSIFS